MAVWPGFFNSSIKSAPCNYNKEKQWQNVSCFSSLRLSFFAFIAAFMRNTRVRKYGLKDMEKGLTFDKRLRDPHRLVGALWILIN
jgi:hypothetical protein